MFVTYEEGDAVFWRDSSRGVAPMIINSIEEGVAKISGTLGVEYTAKFNELLPCHQTLLNAVCTDDRDFMKGVPDGGAHCPDHLG